MYPTLKFILTQYPYHFHTSPSKTLCSHRSTMALSCLKNKEETDIVFKPRCKDANFSFPFNRLWIGNLHLEEIFANFFMKLYKYFTEAWAG